MRKLFLISPNVAAAKIKVSKKPKTSLTILFCSSPPTHSVPEPLNLHNTMLYLSNAALSSAQAFEVTRSSDHLTHFIKTHEMLHRQALLLFPLLSPLPLVLRKY